MVAMHDASASSAHDGLVGELRTNFYFILSNQLGNSETSASGPYQTFSLIPGRK